MEPDYEDWIIDKMKFHLPGLSDKELKKVFKDAGGDYNEALKLGKSVTGTQRREPLPSHRPSQRCEMAEMAAATAAAAAELKAAKEVAEAKRQRVAAMTAAVAAEVEAQLISMANSLLVRAKSEAMTAAAAALKAAQEEAAVKAAAALKAAQEEAAIKAAAALKAAQEEGAVKAAAALKAAQEEAAVKAAALAAARAAAGAALVSVNNQQEASGAAAVAESVPESVERATSGTTSVPAQVAIRAEQSMEPELMPEPKLPPPSVPCSLVEPPLPPTRPEGVPQDAMDLSGDGGLCKQLLRAGDEEGGSPESGSLVQVHYVGTLMDGTKFDSSRDRAGNFSFTIGRGQVIKGWDVGVASMKRGEKALLYCRSDYAYGARGSPPKIPPETTLQFEVELLSWGLPKKDRWEVAEKEKLSEASRLKAEGTEAFKAGKWAQAQPLYAEAAGWVEYDDDFVEESTKAEAGALVISCWLNEAQCCLKLQDWAGAISASSSVLRKDGENVKALYRRGLANTKLQNFETGRQDLKRAATLDPKSREIREALEGLKEAEVRWPLMATDCH
jgi:chemotaxis protein histidine kinase CheA